MNVVILDADGNILEQDIEDLPEDLSLYDEEDAPETDEGGGDPQIITDQAAPAGTDPSALIARLQALKPLIGQTEEPVRGKLLQAFTGAVAQVKAGDTETADTTIGKLEAMLARLGPKTPAAAEPAAAADPLAGQWAEMNGRLGPLVAAFVASGHASGEKVGAAWAMAVQLGTEADYAKALKVAERLEPLLAASQPDKPAAPDLSNLQAALGRLVERAKAVVQAMPERRDDILNAVRQVRTALEAGDAAETKEQLFFADDFLKSLERRGSDLADLQKAMPVSLELCKVNWLEASSAVAARIAEIRDAIRLEIEADDVSVQDRKLKSLEDDITLRGKELAEAMNAVLRAAADTRAALLDRAQKLVADYHRFLSASPLLQHLTGNPLENADDPDHASVLIKPLDDLSTALSDALRQAA